MEYKNAPYIGITDFTHSNQVEPLLQLITEGRSNRLLHVGAMTSRKIIRGEPTKWVNSYPPKRKLEQIFKKREGVLNVLHYADYDSNLTTPSDLVSALYYAGSEVDALQLDMIWPDIGLLRRVKYYFYTAGQNLKFILQVNAKAVEVVGGDPRWVADKISKYNEAEVLDYVLFDMSSGSGTPLDARKLIDFISAVKDIMPDLSVAFAGGLGPSTIHLAEPLIMRFRNLSMDAQSKLRPSGDAMDPIDWAMAAEYTKRAINLISMHE